MILNDNLNINRFLWAKETVESISQGIERQTLILFDVGAGDEILKKAYTSLDVEYNSFDIEPKSDSTLKWDIEQPFPYKNKKADIVTLLEVVEHLNNPWISLKNLSNTLTPAGYLLITTPNPLWSNAKMEIIIKGKLTCFTQSDLDLNHHVFTPWPHILEKLLNDNGFKIISYYTLDGKTRWIDNYTVLKKLPLQLIYRGIKKIIEKKTPESCGMSYAVLAQKI